MDISMDIHIHGNPVNMTNYRQSVHIKHAPAHWSDTIRERCGRCQRIRCRHLLQLTNSLFSLRKTCNSNSSQKAVLCSLLGTLSTLDGLGMISMWVCDDCSCEFYLMCRISLYYVRNQEALPSQRTARRSCLVDLVHCQHCFLRHMGQIYMISVTGVYRVPIEAVLVILALFDSRIGVSR